MLKSSVGHRRSEFVFIFRCEVEVTVNSAVSVIIISHIIASSVFIFSYVKVIGVSCQLIYVFHISGFRIYNNLGIILLSVI